MNTIPRERFWRVPLDSGKVQRLRGRIHIVEERCKGCAYCVEFCPSGVLALSDRFNTKGYHPPDIVKPQICAACHLCELLCPEFAIGVEEIAVQGATDGC